jgi:hypothetical protein
MAMNKGVVSILSMCVAGACSSTSFSSIDSELVLRPDSGAPAQGTAFACSEHDRRVLTPCDVLSLNVTALGISVEESSVRLRLGRTSSAADGPSAAAHITLELTGEQVSGAAARQINITGGLAGSDIEQEAIEGWIEPVATSGSPDGRNAGRFSLTFDWGTMAGSYDSDHPEFLF